MIRLKKNKVPLIFKITLPIFLLCLLLHFITELSVSAADLVNGTVCAVFRGVMGSIFDLIPFSVFEIIIILIPIIVFLIVLFAIRAFKSQNGVRFILTLLSVALIIGSEYILALSISYNTTPTYKKMGVEIVDVTEENLYETLTTLRDEVNLLSGEIEYLDGESRMGYSTRELGDKICSAFSTVNESVRLLNDFSTRPKYIFSGKAMSYLSLLGIYTFYTGEANVNSLYPDYDKAFCAAHEMSHQRGVLREDEANFMAYLALSSSDDPYLRYSAALSMLEYIGSALYRTNKDLYYEVMSTLDERAMSDIRASSAITREYSDTILSDISSFFNDLFLKSNGTAGVVSYGMVVRIAVSYITESGQSN